jgi:hypothetical protein
MSIGQSQCDCYQWESGKNTVVEDVMMTNEKVVRIQQ